MADIDPFMIRALVPDFDALNAGFVRDSVASRARHRSMLDLPYDDGPRQRLDLFFPPDLKAPAPIHVFIHGG